jgi:hypothetical protein
MNRLYFIILSALFMALPALSISDNWSGWQDTSRINGFCGIGDTSLKYTGNFLLSAYENMRVTVYARDTTGAFPGRSNDSVVMEWGFQTGHYAWTSNSGTKVVEWGSQVRVDTFAMTAAANFVRPVTDVDSMGQYPQPKKNIDSVSVVGWAYQRKSVCPYWDVLIRFWVRGLTGNNNRPKLEVMFQAARRGGIKVAP